MRSALLASLVAITLTASAQSSSMPAPHAKVTTVAARRSGSAHRPPHIAHRPLLLARKASPAPLPSAVPTPTTLIKAAPFAQNPINQARGNARVVLVFSPDNSSRYFTRQLALLDHHELALTERDTVFISEVSHRGGPDYVFPGENLSAGTTADQLSARQKFGVPDDQFAVILLDKNGNERFRSAVPVTVDVLASDIDGDGPQDGNRNGR